MKEITWKLSAQTRFNNFISLLRIENPEAVEKWKEKIELNIDKLKKFPEMGKPTKFLSYREIVITSFFHSRRKFN